MGDFSQARFPSPVSMKTVKQILVIVGISLLARTGQAFSTDSEKEIFKGDNFN